MSFRSIPRTHGQGWGRALTVAGLQWIADKGITTGMLYTTASNTAGREALHLARLHHRPCGPVVCAEISRPIS